MLAGDSVETEFEYPCPSPAVGRWFLLRVTRIGGAEPGLLVGHVNVSRRKAAEQDLERRASVDPLTGLANRALFVDQLRAALTLRPGRVSSADVGLLYLDLDGFKPVNDMFGHGAGDEVLMSVAARMTEQTRPQDTVARMGGDEFSVIVPRISDTGLLGLVDRLERTLAEPHLIHGQLVAVGTSMGVYRATPGKIPRIACVAPTRRCTRRSATAGPQKVGSDSLVRKSSGVADHSVTGDRHTACSAQLIITLASVPALFERLDRLEAAAVLVGAMSQQASLASAALSGRAPRSLSGLGRRPPLQGDSQVGPPGVASGRRGSRLSLVGQGPLGPDPGTSPAPTPGAARPGPRVGDVSRPAFCVRCRGGERPDAERRRVQEGCRTRKELEGWSPPRPGCRTRP